MRNKESSQFKIKRTDVIWSVKLFTLFTILSFVFSISIYTVAFLFSQPEFVNAVLISTAQAATSEVDVVNEAIISTSDAATSKVDFGARYIGPLYSVFFFNIIAIFVTSIGAAAITYSHRIVFKELLLRSRHPFYSMISCNMEKLSSPFFSFVQKVALHIYPDIKKNGLDEKNDSPNSIWKHCGYTGEDYRAIASVLPLIFPVLTLFLNSFIAGTVLAFFVFNGILWGSQTLGFGGILVGADFAFIYYFASILPHGIIELPAIFIATSIAYRFARVNSEEITEGRLFEAEKEEDLKEDIRRIENITESYLRSRYLWRIFSIAIFMLLVAAYIEIQLTPKIAGNVIDLMGLLISNLLI
ncbi:stage II sporulation protein M [Methanococcoides orientis]|uniref:stage II sporulation protein M n=1 Tax=Methanococcoides orientis TaxID=2822137 RepID=UPI001E2DA063|nr:stage II sporulation protein M [Methanococcoides orientis]UGV40413.1 stage II sporulation protein M [Methanococcoides orientis]